MVGRNQKVCGGQPIILGTRLTVFNIIWGIYSDGLDSYREDHDLSLTDISNAILYCKDLQCQDSKGEFCYGCLIETLNRTPDIHEQAIEEINLSDNSKVTLQGNNIFLGDMDELKDARFGQMGWSIADSLYKQYFNNW